MLLSWSNFFGALLVLRQHMPGVFNHLDHPQQQKQNKTKKKSQRPKTKKKVQAHLALLCFFFLDGVCWLRILFSLFGFYSSPLSQRERAGTTRLTTNSTRGDFR
ncbi:hypothetical protein MCOR12_004149 [Pyricularia oryzae]|nr:hypothetical protein MCOR09_003337 [Pyricularia oryzae]KAI6601732.1 hypothetical protein MCOR12_004149 [Pyricularia oryzae]